MPRDNIAQQICAVRSDALYPQRNTRSAGKYVARNGMFATSLHARRAKGCCRHDWILRSRRDVSTGYVLRGWSVTERVKLRTGRDNGKYGRASCVNLPRRKVTPRNPNHCGGNAKPAAAAARALASVV